jgi:hypothetical protein
MEMTYRSRYFATRALQRGEITDPVAFLADNARELGIVKSPRKSRPQVAPVEFASNLLHDPDRHFVANALSHQAVPSPPRQRFGRVRMSQGKARCSSSAVNDLSR